MKKKKLKKKLKCLAQRVLEQKEMIYKLSDKYDDLLATINGDQAKLIKECSEKDGKVDILWEWLQRSGIDFSEWVIPNKIEHEVIDYTQYSVHTCSTCKWYELGMDGPCMGCTDKILYSAKGGSTDDDKTIPI